MVHDYNITRIAFRLIIVNDKTYTLKGRYDEYDTSTPGRNETLGEKNLLPSIISIYIVKKKRNSLNVVNQLRRKKKKKICKNNFRRRNSTLILTLLYKYIYIY